MSLRIKCVSCSKSLAVPDRFLGRVFSCPSCGTQQKAVNSNDVNTDVVSPLESNGISSSPSVSDPTESSENDSHSSNRHSRSDGRHGHEEELEWDITPMVDVAFLLLIFFMLTAAFSVQKAIPASAKPDSNARSARRSLDDPQETITIQIDELNTFTVVSSDGAIVEASNKQDLIIQLQDLVNQLGDVAPRVVIQAHSLCIHGAVVTCMDAARQAGFASFQLQSVEEFN